MTALIINRKTLGFLRRIIKIKFPSSVHEWTATAFVDVFFNFSVNQPNFVISLSSPLGNAFIDTNGLHDPQGIVSGYTASPPTGAAQNGSGHLHLGKTQFSANPSAVVSGNFTVAVNDVQTGSLLVSVNATATGVTSGRPGGDAEQTATAQEVDLNGVQVGPFTAFISGAALANIHNVTASCTSSGS